MRGSKFRNVKTVVDGLAFDSQAEARRWKVLLLLQQQGHISALRRQVAFELVRSVRLLGARRATPALRYIADFVYLDAGGREVVEDVKGVITAVYKIKRHLMKAIYNIDILETQ